MSKASSYITIVLFLLNKMVKYKLWILLECTQIYVLRLYSYNSPFSHQGISSGFQPAWGIHSGPALLHLFIIYSRRCILLLLQGVGFREYRFYKAPCLHPLSLQSWSQGPAVLMIRWIYGAISVSHLLPASWRIKGKISGWHWNRDYPVCAIWLQTSTGCFLLLVQLLVQCSARDHLQNTLVVFLSFFHTVQ